MEEEGEGEDLLKTIRDITEFDPKSPTEVLAACNAVAIGLTSLVASIEGATDKVHNLTAESQKLQNDLRNSMATLAQAISGMSRSIKSLSGGVVVFDKPDRRDQ